MHANVWEDIPRGEDVASCGDDRKFDDVSVQSDSYRAKMQDVQLYSKSKALQMNTTKEILQSSKFVSKWKNHTDLRLLDIGCGDGEALVRLVLPLVPRYSSVLAIDILEPMIRASRDSFGSVPRVSFRVFDIATYDAAAIKHLGKFSHITSNFCLHWIKDQRQLFSNIFKLMLPGGQLMATLLLDTELSKAVRELATMDRWAPFMENWRSYPSVYAQNAQCDYSIREQLELAGFEQIEVEIKLQKFDFKLESQLKVF
ncbi:juvenile hormone acid methyltransferase [Culex quinquefasciatus]|uniref:Juvenile hormone acid methyltransferase n=1 Tax=Culex quinquefasciatus TaxID=7176 RepID=B0WQ90_CULQU|nr:juvenile hormone acid methyltransferase [Culex quinquefasciatus]|eukprot:XP_001850874.1 juvenile hormone acid methyltransferase [Culex quinquefasciatus]